MPLTSHQLQLRRSHLGASETPVVLGLSPFATQPRDIYWQKVAATVDDEPTEAQARGHWLEDSLLDWASEQLGVGIVRNQFRVLHEGEGAEILGTPDLTRGQFRYATDAEGVTLQIWHGTDGRGPMREAARTPSRPKG